MADATLSSILIMTRDRERIYLKGRQVDNEKGSLLDQLSPDTFGTWVFLHNGALNTLVQCEQQCDERNEALGLYMTRKYQGFRDILWEIIETK